MASTKSLRAFSRNAFELFYKLKTITILYLAFIKQTLKKFNQIIISSFKQFPYLFGRRLICSSSNSLIASLIFDSICPFVMYILFNKKEMSYIIMLKYASVKSHYYFSTNFHYCFNLFYIKILTEIKSIIVTVGVKPRYFYVSHLTFFVTKPLYVVFNSTFYRLNQYASSELLPPHGSSGQH